MSNRIYSARKPRMTTEEFNQRLRERGILNIWLISPFTRSIDIHKFQCDKGHQFDCRPSDAQYLRPTRKTGCTYCSGTVPWTIETINEWLKINRPDIQIIGEYKNNKSMSEFKCQCGHKWHTSWNHVRSHGTDCPECFRKNRHCDENLMIKYLHEFTMSHIEHGTFSFKNIANQPQKRITVDAHFWYKGREYIFEYNGGQHYKPVTLYGGMPIFKKQQKRDEWLKKHCLQEGITLVSIDGRYFRKEKIKEFIEKFFSSQLHAE